LRGEYFAAFDPFRLRAFRSLSCSLIAGHIHVRETMIKAKIPDAVIFNQPGAVAGIAGARTAMTNATQRHGIQES
jgi:hypothetical protein